MVIGVGRRDVSNGWLSRKVERLGCDMARIGVPPEIVATTVTQTMLRVCRTLDPATVHLDTITWTTLEQESD